MKKEKPKGKSEALHRMTDTTMAKRKRRNQRGNLKLTLNDRKYNG